MIYTIFILLLAVFTLINLSWSLLSFPIIKRLSFDLLIKVDRRSIHEN